MRTRQALVVVLSVVCGMAVTAGLLRADTMFIESFDSGTVGTNLVNQGGNQVIGGQVYTSATQFQERNYIVTNDSDYATSTRDWTCTLDVDNSNTTNLNMVKFGIGSGAPSGLWTNGTIPPDGWFNEPANGVFLNIDMNTGYKISIVTAGSNGFPTEIGTLQTGLVETGTARIKKVGGNLVFGWDQGSTGTFVESTVALSAYPMLSANSKLFFSVFEGNTTTWVDNFQVVPEPCTISLLFLGVTGLLAYAWRKRR